MGGEHDKRLLRFRRRTQELAMAEQDPNSSDTAAAGPTGPRWRPNATIELKGDEGRAEPAPAPPAGAASEPPPAAARESTDADAVSAPEAVAAGACGGAGPRPAPPRGPPPPRAAALA